MTPMELLAGLPPPWAQLSLVKKEPGVIPTVPVPTPENDVTPDELGVRQTPWSPKKSLRTYAATVVIVQLPLVTVSVTVLWDPLLGQLDALTSPDGKFAGEVHDDVLGAQPYGFVVCHAQPLKLR